MELITVLSLITMAGIILLIGLFVACLRYVYITVSSQTTGASNEWAGDGPAGETDGNTVRGGAGDASIIAGDTGDFVFGSTDENSGSSDPRR